MKKYQVTFVATYEATITIEAPDRDKAMERAEYLLNAEGEIYPEHMTHNGTKSDMTSLIDAVDEFKRCCISAADLMAASAETEGSLAQKLEELSLLLEGYDALCALGRRDPRDQETQLLEHAILF